MKYLSVLILITTVLGYSKSQPQNIPVTPVKGISLPVNFLAVNFAKEAKISLITLIKSNSVKFSSSAGIQEDLIQILKDNGMNSIRLSVWVNPAGG